MSDKMSRKVPGRPFAKGQSGNPIGRAKGAEGLADRVKKATKDGADIVEFLMGVVKNKSRHEATKDRIGACVVLLNRGWGSPVQATELTVLMQQAEARVQSADSAFAQLPPERQEAVLRAWFDRSQPALPAPEFEATGEVPTEADMSNSAGVSDDPGERDD